MLTRLFKTRIKKREVPWCCMGFEAGYDSAGRRGAAYLVGRDSLNEPEFIIQHRAVDQGKEGHLQSDILAAIITDSRIVFCPSCGVNLAQFYERYIDALFRDDLELGVLKEHDTFVVAPQD